MPEEVAKLTQAGIGVYVETGAGSGLQIPDDKYRRAGAKIVQEPAEAIGRDMIVKLKALSEEEAAMMKPGGIALAMIHQEQSPQNALAIARAGGVAVAMESICNEYGERAVDCTDMTGEQAMIFAFHLFEKVPWDCKVLIMGYGRVATGAITIASKLGARVKILRKSQYETIEHFLEGTDILVNGITWPSEKRENHEYVVTRSMLGLMNRPGMVVDLSVDYPNPVETSRPTDMREPTYEVDGVVHMGIYGYPALVPYSSSERYSRQLLPIIMDIAANGLDEVGPAIRQAIVDWRDRVEVTASAKETVCIR
jgi:N5-(carboxyethyl)ornithine synthase